MSSDDFYELADHLWVNCDKCKDNIWCDEYDNNHDCNCDCHEYALKIRQWANTKGKANE